ncbi:fatty acid desaturase [Mycolicibacterium madagascariense]|uniref:Fatty acid desaturase n=1 Tax=Mycolicibacterium madagascariense TaxID=212765 RepID=A0A7I7XBT9_9MYCO|nr:acyl-CoA desaturase [Mycolicibacterium madagascariense]MCV7011772.1 acyl-CoA desaturase [Mycolicibacterium madagascariense]BBZ26377.1 fatty acid desaturase [Mycolicibacterium madagascariense]
MAISDVAAYAHLSESDLTAFAAALDDIRRDVEDSRGARDRTYIRRTIAAQRCLEVASRLAITGSTGRRGWWLGVLGLAAAKSIENMELAHNIGHGQWDWMNDPEIHSTTWEWDMAGLSSHWRFSHNYRHHVNTNVLGVDDDLGYGVMRVSRDQEWKPSYLLQPLRSLLLAATFEWGIALHDLYSELERADTDVERSAQRKALLHKVGRQMTKDYLIFPALSLRRWRRVLGANVVANSLRNVWAYVVICCGHFADGAETFDPATLVSETKPEWYLRQMLGSANFDAGPVMAFMSGNLCYQIEHHLFPDLPSNRLAAISRRVRALCAEYELPYTTGPLLTQYLLTLRNVFVLALPDRFTTRRNRKALADSRFDATAPVAPAGRHRIPTAPVSVPALPAGHRR